jgi:hypothetical protein
MKLVRFILAVLVDASATVWLGFAFWKLWGWFFVPLGLPEVTMPHALGIAVTVAVATNQFAPGQMDDDNMPERIVYAFVMPATALLTGWILH